MTPMPPSVPKGLRRSFWIAVATDWLLFALVVGLVAAAIWHAGNDRWDQGTFHLAGALFVQHTLDRHLDWLRRRFDRTWRSGR